jgi:hypothetical protein
MRQRVFAVVVTLLVAVMLTPFPAVAQAPSHVDGGGNAAGPDTASQFGMGINVASNGSVSGQFNCVMAGKSAMDGLSDMTVRGSVTSATITPAGVTFGGVGTLNMKSTQSSSRETMTVAYSVTVTPGGPGVGTLALVVPAADFAMAETVTSGQISVR